jgi:SPP1 gp7 family putative phage head morphogenesis protein
MISCSAIDIAVAKGKLKKRESLRESDDASSNADEVLEKAFTPTELAYIIMDATGAEYRMAYQEASAVLELGLNFAVIPTAARNALQQFADKFAASVVGDERAALLGAIDAGLAKGLGPPDLANVIAALFDEGVHRQAADGSFVAVNVDDWANTVAATELSRAYNYGALSLYTDAGYDEIEWVAAEDDLMCEQCGELDGETISIGDSFSSGDNQPPAHPVCRCTIMADPDARGALDPDARAIAAHGNADAYDDDLTESLREGWVTIDGHHVLIGEEEGEGGQSREELERRTQDVLNQNRAFFDGTKSELTGLFPGYKVEGRMKDLTSAADKADRKYGGDPTKIGDISGFRVTGPISAFPEIQARIEANFNVTKTESFVDEPRGDGYRSIHMDIDDGEGHVGEIQIRTENETLWADWAHDAFYKPPEGVSLSPATPEYARAMSEYLYRQDIGDPIPKPDCPSGVPCL